MQKIHLPVLGPRYWVALCIASIFGANMGDFFAHNLGLGHVAGLPFLALALAIVVFAERFDRSSHESYYWIAIIIVRTAATNFADFACGDLKLPRLLVTAALAVVLAAAVWTSWRLAWRSTAADKALILSSAAEPGHSSFFAERHVERRLDRVEVGVQVLGFGIDVEQPGDDLPLGGVVLLQEVHRREPVVRVVIGVELAQRERRAVVLLDQFDRARRVIDRDRLAAGDDVEPVHRLVVLAHVIEALGRAGVVVERDAGRDARR
jgi:hypothetical protein